MREITYRIARTGVVPAAGAPPPGYAPWAGARLHFARTGGDYAPGVVRPRDTVQARTDERGEGAVLLAPGRYRITLPSGESCDSTLSADGGALDLAALLAGGVEPTDPRYPTLLAHVDQRIDEETSGRVQEAIDAGEVRIVALLEESGAAVDALLSSGEERVATLLSESATAVQAVLDQGTTALAGFDTAQGAALAGFAQAADDALLAIGQAATDALSQFETDGQAAIGRADGAARTALDAATVAEQETQKVAAIITDAGEATKDARKATQDAIDAAQPLTEQREAAEAAAALAAERADRTPAVATLAELHTLTPYEGRIRYCAEIGRPAWADGTEWRVAQGWLANFDRLKIIDAQSTGSDARLYLNVAPMTPGARE